MILTNREQQIIKTILSQPAGVNRDELAKQLNVSRRTIYRELAQLEDDIHQLQLRLVKDTQGSYRIVGEAGALAKLRTSLTSALVDITFDQTQRQNALLIRLLMSAVPQTMGRIASELAVSVTTVKQDLDLITPALTASHLVLKRQKATGVWVSGKEHDIRRVLVGIFASALNPYLFFQALKAHTEATFDPVTRYFYDRLPQPQLQAANAVFQRTPSLANFTDNQRKTLLLTVTVNAMRVQAGYHVQALRDFNQERLFQDQQLALQFYAEMDASVRAQVRVGDYQFLAKQLNGIRGGLAGERVDLFDLTVNLQVQALIKAVEAQVDYPFSQESSLYSSLLAHVQRATSGAVAPVLANPVLDHLVADYPKLYQAVKNAADQVFGTGAFVGNELSYLVLYFASRVSTGDVSPAAKVLLVTTDGPGTSKLIASKLELAVSAIKTVRSVRIADLPNVDYGKYALILSTVQLPGFAHQYLVVSPLVTATEIAAIRKALKQSYTPSLGHDMGALDRSVTVFETLHSMVTAASALLQGFDVTTVAATTPTIRAVLKAILGELPQVVTDEAAVLSALLKRLTLAPVGIPETTLALIHTANAGVKRPFIGVFDLEKPVPLASMDMKQIQLHRVLLLLTPQDAPHSVLQLLSAVSATMVQDDQLLRCFESGTYSQIYPLITDAMLTEIKKIDRR